MQINKKIVQTAIKRKFVRPLKDGCEYNVKKLEIEQRTKHRETLNLLLQANKTLNNVEYNLNCLNLVDSNTLMRSALENIMMGMLIQFEDNVYNEFIDLTITDDTRKYTKIIKIIDKFRTKLNIISENLFIDMNREEKLKLFTDLYDKLCKFTHSSLVVNVMMEVKYAKEKEVLKMLISQNYYFLKILLFCCLKYFTNDKKHYLEFSNISFTQLFFLADINDKIKTSKIDFNKYKEFLYYENNLEYFNKNAKDGKELQEEINELAKDIKNNSEKFGEELQKFLK